MSHQVTGRCCLVTSIEGMIGSPSLGGAGCLRCIQGLPSAVPLGMVETPHGISLSFLRSANVPPVSLCEMAAVCARSAHRGCKTAALYPSRSSNKGRYYQEVGMLTSLVKLYPLVLHSSDQSATMLLCDMTAMAGDG